MQNVNGDLKNRTGHTDNDQSLAESKEVILSWPYKDCVLESGQTREDHNQPILMWSKVLNPSEIDRLFSPKAFYRFRKITPEGEYPVEKFSPHNNLIIKGNNLVALHSLLKRFAGRIKLIYIDPPYNTGNNGFNYHDTFNSSTWLTFMKNRIEIARELLSKDGSIWINIDDKESHYLKVLCDEIFGRDNFVINFIWQKKYSPANDAKWFSDVHDHILVLPKTNLFLNPTFCHGRKL